jgi:two-component system phosphate regulon sensor histidine kinase PhoR
MARKRLLIWQLYTRYVLASVLSLILAVWFCSAASRHFFLTQVTFAGPSATQSVDAAVAHVRSQILISGVVIILVGTLVSWLLSRRISTPLREMRAGVERFARGEFSLKLPVPDTEELGGLAEVMNKTGRQLAERIQTVVEQQNEQQAVLGSMVEGVIAVDRQERVIHLNRAAADLLQVDDGAVRGRSIQEVVRNYDLHSYVKEILQLNFPAKREIVLVGNESRYLQLYGAVLRNIRGDGIGAVLVLHDVTQVRHLERVRRDFVANVSHELRTPITSIKGFVETLLD